ncbi:MAG: acyl-CoA dehydrogenase family protein [Acidobacteria bacterium]|nr:acyl-CoA dehydrogenase family protein [Acidobacteriota bacterium]
MTLDPVLSHLLAAEPAPLAAGDDPAGWYRSFREEVLAPWQARSRGGADPSGRHHFAHALLGGFVADRPAWAMVAGHQAAVRRLAWERGGQDLVPEGGIVAFCASEEGGAHPRAVHASLRKAPDGGFRLDGQKRWATLAPSAAALLIIASLGRDGDRNRLRAVCVPSDRRGISIAPMAVTSPTGGGDRKPSNPEVRHAVVDLAEVPVAAGEVMDGDGYVDAIKPFRTIEDLYIGAATTAYNLALARRSGWPEAAVEDLLLLLVAAGALAFGPLDEPAAHLGVEALSRATARVRADHAEHWALVDEAAAAAWRRAAGGAGVAARAKELRRQGAWARLAASLT